ncbi:hypothetical protein ACIA8C_04280 [Nocardia sp. NPDC051321]|uniref:hypothetical protein n=1 Tax=Nocardia sp. NPDC051321 TaxID=3364323 RepID=UPI0037A780C8
MRSLDIRQGQPLSMAGLSGAPAPDGIQGPHESQHTVHSHVGLALEVVHLSAERSALAGMLSADTEIVVTPRSGAFTPGVPVDGWLVSLYSIGEEDSGPLLQRSTSDASAQGLIELIASVRRLR